MSKNLIVDGKNYGEVVKYVQRRGGLFPCWDFLMNGNSINIQVPMFMIKSFTSSDDLEIVTYGKDKTATA